MTASDDNSSCSDNTEAAHSLLDQSHSPAGKDELFLFCPSRIADNLWVTVSMLGMIYWGWRQFEWPVASSLPELTLVACGLICFGQMAVINRSAILTGLLSATVLVAFAFIGVAGNNADVARLLPLSAQDSIIYGRERWEAVALVSTAFMAIIYLDALDRIRNGYGDRRGFKGISFIVFCLLASAASIYFALVHLQDLEAHYIRVLFVTIFFALVDIHIWLSLSDCKNEKDRQFAHDSKFLLFLLDSPVLIALLALGFFAFFRLNCPTDVLATAVPPPPTYKNALSPPCVEIYPFLAGALAFQMLSYNLIYVFFSFGLHLTNRDATNGGAE